MPTLAVFRTIAKRHLGLDTSDSELLTLIDKYVNDGVREVMLETHCKVSTGEHVFTTNDGDYTLDTDVMEIFDLKLTTSEGAVLPLQRVSIHEINEFRRTGADVDTTTHVFAMAGENLVLLYPNPNIDDTLTFYYVPKPTALSATGDSPSDIPEHMHPLIEYYMLAKLADLSDNKAKGVGEKYLKQYEVELAKRRRNTRNKVKMAKQLVPGNRRIFRRERWPDQDMGH